MKLPLGNLLAAIAATPKFSFNIWSRKPGFSTILDDNHESRS